MIFRLIYYLWCDYDIMVIILAFQYHYLLPSVWPIVRGPLPLLQSVHRTYTYASHTFCNIIVGAPLHGRSSHGSNWSAVFVTVRLASHYMTIPCNGEARLSHLHYWNYTNAQLNPLPVMHVSLSNRVSVKVRRRTFICSRFLVEGRHSAL